MNANLAKIVAAILLGCAPAAQAHNLTTPEIRRAETTYKGTATCKYEVIENGKKVEKTAFCSVSGQASRQVAEFNLTTMIEAQIRSVNGQKTSSIQASITVEF